MGPSQIPHVGPCQLKWINGFPGVMLLESQDMRAMSVEINGKEQGGEGGYVQIMQSAPESA